MQNKWKNRNKFDSEETDLVSIKKEIHNLEINRTSLSSDIPTKILKKNNDTFAEFLWENINSSIKSSTFPSCLKSADVRPLRKKDKNNLKSN